MVTLGLAGGFRIVGEVQDPEVPPSIIAIMEAGGWILVGLAWALGVADV